MGERPWFSKDLARLEQIVRKLESPDLDLDEALKLFEEGIKQARSCEKKLSEAEGKVEKLIQENENFYKEDFEA